MKGRKESRMEARWGGGGGLTSEIEILDEVDKRDDGVWGNIR